MANNRAINVINAVLTTGAFGDNWISGFTRHENGITRTYSASNDYTRAVITVNHGTEYDDGIASASYTQYVREDGMWVPGSAFSIDATAEGVLAAILEESGINV